MSALSIAEKCRSSMAPILRWWRAWTEKDSLRCCGEDEVARVANDLGMSAADLHTLVSRGPDAADLLLRRMKALDLERDEVSRVEPAMFRDLQKVCSLCQSRKQCVGDLAHDADNPRWQDYCPNAATLMVLNGLPWSSRREW